MNEDADIERAIDRGVDGIISDWPDQVPSILAHRSVRAAGPRFVAGLPQPGSLKTG